VLGDLILSPQTTVNDNKNSMTMTTENKLICGSTAVCVSQLVFNAMPFKDSIHYKLK